MRWHIDLCGAEPVIRDVPVYDSTKLYEGQLLMLGNSIKGTDDNSTAFQTAYEGTQNLQAVDALGICMETTTDVTAAADLVTADYAKAIINPFAVYTAEYSQHANDDLALTATLSSTTLTITSHGSGCDMDSGWILTANASTTAKFAGQLFMVLADNDTDMTLHATPTTSGETTNDTLVEILPINFRLTMLNAGATALKTTAAANTGLKLGIMENYIESDELPFQPLRPQIHAPTTNLSLINARAYADIVMLDHVYNRTD